MIYQDEIIIFTVGQQSEHYIYETYLALSTFDLDKFFAINSRLSLKQNLARLRDLDLLRRVKFKEANYDEKQKSVYITD